jgi:hypothetical protein
MVDWFGLNAFDGFRVMRVFQESILKMVGFIWMIPQTFVAFAE